MTGGSNIRAIGSEGALDAQDHDDTEQAADASGESEFHAEEDEAWEDTSPSKRRFGWIAPALALIAVAAWTGAFVWANQSVILSGANLQHWIDWIVSWSVPVVLIVALWLLAMRNSRREAFRFGEVAKSLSHESAELERRLATVNRELSLAREFLGSQSRELDSLGRVASERLSEHAATLQDLVMRNGEQIGSIATVSDTALENMSRLRDDLPVIANSAKDVSNQIGTAGRTAHGQIAELVSGFERLNQFGKASESQVASIRSRVDETLELFERRIAELEELADNRFDALDQKSNAFRAQMDGREVEALAAIRRRADALGNELAAARQSLRDDEEEAIATLRARLGGFREEAGVIAGSIREGENEAVEIWNSRIEALRAQLTDAIAQITRLDEQAIASANAKLEALRIEAETVDANIAARDANLLEQVAKRRKALDQDENEALDRLGRRLANLDEAIAERRENQLAEADALAERSEAIIARIDGMGQSIRDVAESAETTQSRMAGHADALSANLAHSREAIEGTDAFVAELTEATVRLLELIQASVQHSSNDLPEAIGIAEARLSTIRDNAGELDAAISEAGRKSEDLSAYVLAARETSQASMDDLDKFSEKLAGTSESTDRALAGLRQSLAALAEESDALSEKAQGELKEAIAQLEEAARTAPALIAEEVSENIGAIADLVGKEANNLIAASLTEHAMQSVAEIEQAATQAGTAGRETARQLRDQLARVDELAGNLESRVAHAREQAEEQVGNDFARRMALITESLNSNAIDIAKALSTDVTDTAWASYLRGDRGIFTRRAVSLLDNTVARDIAEVFDEDPDFRENVSRYIHDFEAMLRSMLSTRDGNALGVTLLGSDMGKLYVALAQSIERLRQ